MEQYGCCGKKWTEDRKATTLRTNADAAGQIMKPDEEKQLQNAVHNCPKRDNNNKNNNIIR